VLSGANGAALAQGEQTVGYHMPTLLDVDGDGRDEVLLHASAAPLRLLDDDLTPLWLDRKTTGWPPTRRSRSVRASRGPCRAPGPTHRGSR